jgi:hypothetical protein
MGAVEQMLYEIQNPGAYIVPDVSCDWRKVAVQQIDEETVKVSGGVGTFVPDSYKVCCIVKDEKLWQVQFPLVIVGDDCVAKARKTANALKTRCENMFQLMGKKNPGPFA